MDACFCRMKKVTKNIPVQTNSSLDWEARKHIATTLVLATALSLMFTGQSWQAQQETVAADEAQSTQYASLADEYVTWQAEQDRNNALPQPASFTSMRNGLSDLIDIDYTMIEVASITADERRCLAEAIYYESAYEPVIGQMAVADVILNRVKSAQYPDSVCGVVYQGSHRVTGCQFSFTCDGSLERDRHAPSYTKAEAMAGAVLAGMHLPVSKNATHYHADYMTPYWAPKLTQTAVIGAHKFYKLPNKTTITAAAQ